MPARPDAPTVAHVAHTAEPGGAELALARVLANDCREWDARLVVPGPTRGGAFDGLVDVDVREAGVPQPPGASRATPWAAIRFAVALARQAFATRRSGAFRGAGVVHANSTRAAVYTALALLGTRTPLVVHLRDRVEAGAIGRFGLLAFRLTAARRAVGFIANSAATAETILPHLRAGQFVEVVPSAIGISRASTASTAHDGPVRIGMVARLDPWKGQEELIRAYAAAGIDYRASLTLIGSAAFGHDAYESRLRALVAELGLRAVTFAGFRADVQDRIDDLDVCVQYSTRPEPLGQNVLQYLARGRAVIAAAEGGPLEWVADGVNGMLVPPNDVAALSAALRRLVDDATLRARLGAGALATEGLRTDCEVTQAHARVFARAASRSH
ncbi:glycosyltransferase family 4 protein [Microbacterium sp. JZ31]|uniref:glycosyltransferase family 4 protein n=1 Tax=Microbacterium sp. JZ31 TaxID=1906274 RepID=UPI001934A7E1|nr:glycosyltransferase family 4 protein [Microbacterium sp. JZ31]